MVRLGGDNQQVVVAVIVAVVVDFAQSSSRGF